MKKYSVNVHCDYVFHAEVEAENEEQAHEIAAQMCESSDMNRFEFNDVIGICTTDVEDVD